MRLLHFSVLFRCFSFMHLLCSVPLFAFIVSLPAVENSHKFYFRCYAKTFELQNKGKKLRNGNKNFKRKTYFRLTLDFFLLHHVFLTFLFLHLPLSLSNLLNFFLFHFVFFFHSFLFKINVWDNIFNHRFSILLKSIWISM